MKENHNYPIVIYDGKCILCSNAIRWILRHESELTLKFASLESGLIQELQFLKNKKETIFFHHNGTVSDRSSAVFKIASYLKSPWNWLKYFSVLPKVFTDGCYKIIAKNRYRFFGKVEDVCLLPYELGDRYIG